MNSRAAETLDHLLEGNERFRSGQSHHHRYAPEKIRELGDGRPPIAAVVACSDGRVTPEIVFDQPLTNLFVSRVPGNVASDSAKWMLELAVSDLRVPLVIVMGHTGCLAIKQVLDGLPGAGGSLRMDVARAVHTAKLRHSEDPFREAVKVNALQTVDDLKLHSTAVRSAQREGRLDLLAAVYDVHTGEVQIVEGT